MQHKPLIAPVLTYLFHRLEARFDGRPTLLILDEAWIFLDDAIFAARIREWLKTLRKKNVAVVFATQSLADIERSQHRAGADRKLPDAHLPAQRSRDRAAGAQRLRALRPQCAPDRNPQPAPRPSATTTPRPRAAIACSSLDSDRWRWRCAAACSPDDQRLIDRCIAGGTATGFVARLSRRQRTGVGGRAARTLASSRQPATANSTCHRNRSGRRCAHSRATPVRPDTFAEGSGAARRTPHRRGAAAWPSRRAAVVGTPVALPDRSRQSQEERRMRRLHRMAGACRLRRRRSLHRCCRRSAAQLTVFDPAQLPGRTCSPPRARWSRSRTRCASCRTRRSMLLRMDQNLRRLGGGIGRRPAEHARRQLRAQHRRRQRRSRSECRETEAPTSGCSRRDLRQPRSER